MIITNDLKPSPKLPFQQAKPLPKQPPLTVGMARMDEPPPYALQVHPNQVPPSPPSPQLPRLPPRPVPTQQRSASSGTSTFNTTRPITNHLYFKTKHESIVGTFPIDPDIQAVALDKSGATTVDRRDYNRKHRQRHRHHGRKSFKKQPGLPDPNAIFSTRQGSIELNLAIVAVPDAMPSRALVQAASRQGNIDIKVHGIHPRRGLNMEVSSRNGDILVLIPRSFSGYIQIYSRHGHLVFLPALSQSMHLVSRHEREAQAVVGDAINRFPMKGMEWDGDTLHVASRNGNILIGYVGEDRKPAAEPTLWQKLTGVLQKSIAHKIEKIEK